MRKTLLPAALFLSAAIAAADEAPPGMIRIPSGAFTMGRDGGPPTKRPLTG